MGLLNISEYTAVFAAALLVAGCGDDVSCKVENVGGIPRMTLDGKPIRARMLYVSPTYFPMSSATGRTVPAGAFVDTFCEIPELEKPVMAAAEISFSTPVACEIGRFEVVEYESGKSVAAMNPSGDPEISAVSCNPKNPASIKFPEKDGRKFLRVDCKNPAKIVLKGVKFDTGKRHKICVSIKCDKPAMFNMYASVGGKFFEPKTRSFVGAQTRLAADAGVDIITFPVQAADFMPEDGKSFDYSNLKGALDEILAANPNAKILVRIRFYPPEWWMNKYKADVMCDESGNPNKIFPSPSSLRFRTDSVAVLNRIIDFCEGNYRRNIIGYHPGGGHSCEWFYPDTRGPWLGYEQAAQAAWKLWLKKKYGSDDALQKAWKDSSATFANASVPLPDERKKAFCLINPQTQKKLFDYNMFRQDEMFDAMNALAKTIRKRVPNKLSAIFYGYIATASFKGAANTGHFAFQKMLASPNFDIICGPASYVKRDLGHGGMQSSSTESIIRAGKIWINEDDIRTYRVPPTQQQITSLGKELRTRADTLMVLQRNMAQEAIRNCGNWWMDLGGMGWFDDPELWKLMSAFEKIERDMIEHPTEYKPDVALIFDERSVCYGGAAGTNYRTMLIAPKARTDFTDSIQVTQGNYLLDDFLFGKPMSAKLAVITVACALDANQRAAMRRRTRGCAAIFVWTTGLIDADKNVFSLDTVEEATGFKVKYASGELGMQVVATQEGRKIGLSKLSGTNKISSPLLVPQVERGDTVLATYTNGEPAVVLRGKHLFCATALPQTELYVYMSKIAGAHFYSKDRVNVFAAGNYLSATCIDDAKTPRDIVLDIPSDKNVYDALTGEKLGRAPHIVLKMKRGDNRVLRLE